MPGNDASQSTADVHSIGTQRRRVRSKVRCGYDNDKTRVAEGAAQAERPASVVHALLVVMPCAESAVLSLPESVRDCSTSTVACEMKASKMKMRP